MIGLFSEVVVFGDALVLAEVGLQRTMKNKLMGPTLEKERHKRLRGGKL